MLSRCPEGKIFGLDISEESVRKAFCEEMSDVLMYFHDTLLRYGISAEEISNAYIEKHERNMGRNYTEEYKNKYESKNCLCLLRM